MKSESPEARVQNVLTQQKGTGVVRLQLKMDVVNIIGLLALISSTLSLLSLLPAMANLSFSYALFASAALFVCSICLFMRKNWARVGVSLLLFVALVKESKLVIDYLSIKSLTIVECLPLATTAIANCLFYVLFLTILNTKKNRANFK